MEQVLMAFTARTSRLAYMEDMSLYGGMSLGKNLCLLVVRQSLSLEKHKDQKVSWHATPFEERLKKALSDEFTSFKHDYLQSGASPEEFTVGREKEFQPIQGHVWI
ncbi:hypothetical protein COLO4_38028 [Corchorus olitorius]|uniref:Uncharacterized protein n=1 Tax=Corchorus olitorius TaxID=93759 RepID=A0A1R3FXU0_9ROSI|nr:hypothetical protein COLO4_38028 [Corchorus olitorius]